MKRDLFWKNISGDSKKRLNILLDSGINKRKKKGRFLSPGLITKFIVSAVFLAIVVCSVFFMSHNVMAFFLDDAKFEISRIEISNMRIFTAEEILSMSGLSRRQNIFKADINEFRKRLEENANIKRAVVERGLPGKIRVKVYEREPVAVLEIGKKYLIDEECVLLSWDERWNVGDLPVITGVGSEGKFLDKKVSSENLEEGIRLVLLYNATRMKPVINVIKIDVSNIDGISFYTDKDFIFKMTKGNGKEKFDQLKVVYEDMKTKGTLPDVIDLRFQDVIVIPKNVAGKGAKK